jgi:hypothetical protein
MAAPRLGLLAAAALTALVAGGYPAHADPLPSGSLGIMFGAGGGTGQYARKLGLGYYQFGGQAAWQPMTTEQRVGWSLKWQFVFGTMYGAESARINVNLLTLQMDLMAGLRIRPGQNLRRYLALRGGVELFRANEGIQPDGGGDRQRAFVGPVAAATFEQYAFGAFLFNVDVRYGLIGSGPAEIALLVGASISVF